MSTPANAERGTHVLIPVKHLARAKSRLAPSLENIERRLLALAMLEDTILAASASPLVGRITVVTPDDSAARRAHLCGVLVLQEGPRLAEDPASPLNAALDAAARQVRAEFDPQTLVVLQADLPALRASELTSAIRGSAGVRAIVADYSGTGTTTLISTDEDAELLPRFGPWSAREHQLDGAVSLDGDWPGLRCDVDTAEDLRRVHRLGVGPATGAFLAGLDDIDWHSA